MPLMDETFWLCLLAAYFVGGVWVGSRVAYSDLYLIHPFVVFSAILIWPLFLAMELYFNWRDKHDKAAR